MPKIRIEKAHIGDFNKYKERTGKTTEEALHSKDPHVRKMAQFAANAKKFVHKQFGGNIDPEHPLSKFIKMYQEGGSVTGDDPGGSGTSGAMKMDNAPETAEGDTQAGQQAQQQMGTAYNPGTDPNNPVNDPANKPVMNADASQNSPSPNTAAPRTPASRDVYGNLLGAGLTAASFFEDKRNQRNAAGYNRQQGISDNVFGAQKLSQQGQQKGDYNQQGVFRPNANTPYAPGLISPTMQYGGDPSRSYITDIPDAEISRLKKLGYKIETL